MNNIIVGLAYNIKNSIAIVTYKSETTISVVYQSTGKRENLTINEFKKYLR